MQQIMKARSLSLLLSSARSSTPEGFLHRRVTAVRIGRAAQAWAPISKPSPRALGGETERCEETLTMSQTILFGPA